MPGIMLVQEFEHHGEEKEHPFMNFGIKVRVKAKEVASPNAFTLKWSGVGQGGVTPLRVPLEECNEFLATKTDIPDLRLLLYGRVPMLATLRRFNGRILGDHG